MTNLRTLKLLGIKLIFFLIFNFDKIRVWNLVEFSKYGN